MALVLSGGTGNRIGGGVPKQYQIIAGKPVLVHTLEQFRRCEAVEGVIAVASPQWADSIWRWKAEFGLEKLLAVAPAGEDRQLSIRSGLLAAQAYMDTAPSSGVIIQDAVRPLTSAALLARLLEALREAPGVMPALPVTDTTYTSRDGQWVDGLLERSTLYGGQAPEAFHYWPYLALYRDTPDEELRAMSGSCQLPCRRGWKIKIIPGDPGNLKITYPGDLELCRRALRKEED